MDKSETMLGDMCLAMGAIADGCRTLNLITEMEYTLVRPKPVKYPYVNFLYNEEDAEDSHTSDKVTIKRDDGVAAYLTSNLVTLLDTEITKHQSRLFDREKNNADTFAWWSLSYDKNTGEVQKDNVYVLCVKAAPMFKELVDIMKNYGLC